jgi:3-deoxy-D-manno-octulosonic-acid transferase
VGAVSGLDAERLRGLGARTDRTVVTGDARVDQIFRRLECDPCVPPVIGRLREPGVPVIVAGSTWPPDEDRLIPAFGLLRGEDRSALRLIVAPHQPTVTHLVRLETRLRAAGLRSVRLADVERGSRLEEVVIVDRVGMLADLYRLASAAWVGGGFGDDGLHSVLEPAALGVPVLFGPRFGNAREAQALVTAGGGFVASDAGTAAARLRAVLADGGRAGLAARGWVESQRGGAARNAAVLVNLLRGAPVAAIDP